MQFPPELEVAAFRLPNGEYAWQRSEALDAVRGLAGARYAVLGGELWLIRDEKVWAVLPQQSGPPAVCAWETERRLEEPWPTYVSRASDEAQAAIRTLPREGEVATPPKTKLYYNLTWAGADE
jgi:hypothetical protein